jgi:hypothetical protein
MILTPWGVVFDSALIVKIQCHHAKLCYHVLAAQRNYGRVTIAF